MELSWFVFLIIGMAIGTIYGSRLSDEWWRKKVQNNAIKKAPYSNTALRNLPINSISQKGRDKYDRN